MRPTRHLLSSIRGSSTPVSHTAKSLHAEAPKDTLLPLSAVFASVSASASAEGWQMLLLLPGALLLQLLNADRAALAPVSQALPCCKASQDCIRCGNPSSVAHHRHAIA